MWQRRLVSEGGQEHTWWYIMITKRLKLIISWYRNTKKGFEKSIHLSRIMPLHDIFLLNPPLSKHEGMLDLFCPISSKFWFNVTLTKYGHIISLAVNEPVITWCNLWRVAYRYPAGSREGWERCKSSLRLQTKITHNNNNNIWNINL